MKKLLFLAAMLIVCNTFIYAVPNNMIMAGGYEVFQVKATSSSQDLAQNLNLGNGSSLEMKIDKFSIGAYEIIGNVEINKLSKNAYGIAGDEVKINKLPNSTYEIIGNEIKINKLSNGAYEIAGDEILQKAGVTSYNNTIPNLTQNLSLENGSSPEMKIDKLSIGAYEIIGDVKIDKLPNGAYEIVGDEMLKKADATSL